MDASSPSTPPAVLSTATHNRAVQRRATVGAVAGNFVEWYDFFVYGSLAAVIGPLFFPAADPTTSLLTAFAVYGAAFVARPIGALVFGNLGDRIGRRITLSAVILVMSGASFLIGLLPTYAAAGPLAAVLLVALRLIQGFSAGGEFGGAASFVVEYAPPNRRGLYGSWITVGFGAGLAFGAIVGAAVSSILSPEQMSSWGWRIPFLVALPLGFIGLYLRLRLEETPHFEAVKSERKDVRTPILFVIRTYPREIVVGLGVLVASSLPTYIFYVYVPSYLAVTKTTTLREALTLTVISLLVYVALLPIMGRLSDSVGRRPMLIGGATAQIVVGYPCFWLLNQHSFGLALTAFVLFAVAAAPLNSQLAVFSSEMFPTVVRYGGVSIIYTFANMVFGGGTPLLMTWLTAATRNPIVPGYFIVGAGVISLLSALALRETYRKPLADA